MQHYKDKISDAFANGAKKADEVRDYIAKDDTRAAGAKYLSYFCAACALITIPGYGRLTSLFFMWFGNNISERNKDIKCDNQLTQKDSELRQQDKKIEKLEKREKELEQQLEQSQNSSNFFQEISEEQNESIEILQQEQVKDQEPIIRGRKKNDKLTLIK